MKGNIESVIRMRNGRGRVDILLRMIRTCPQGEGEFSEISKLVRG